jgi:uncharacterized repeat protein (TIGR03803 family)
MKTLEVGRHVLVGFAAATMLAGCGALRQAQDDTQPPIGATGAIPQTVAFESAKAALRTGASKSLQVVLDFQHYRGTHPSAPLLDLNGTLYGTTSQGGKYKRGTVYSISPTGAFKTLHYFGEGYDGARPMAGLIDVNGTLYGTTEFGGTSGVGTAYAISTSGSEKVLYNFTNGADGGYPWGPVTNIDGTLYGTTNTGGDLSCRGQYFSGCGTVYSLSPSGSERVLHSFTGGSDGSFPYYGLLDVKGVLYGTTAGGGDTTRYNGCCGTVFRITTAGEEKVVHGFTGSDGSEPFGPLVNIDGTLYGTASEGGKPDIGSGVVFSLSMNGAVKVLHFFTDDKTDGQEPEGQLVYEGGALYGTTYLGGVSCKGASCGPGTIFSVTLAGVEKVLYRFSISSGFEPVAGLTAAEKGLYGTTMAGGSHCAGGRAYPDGCGTVFVFSL